MGVATVAAAVLAIGLVTAAPAAAAAPRPPVMVATITIGDVCAALAKAIAFLEERPASRLRDFLLTQAQAAFDAHCR
jgi:hypothetical protein